MTILAMIAGWFIGNSAILIVVLISDSFKTNKPISGREFKTDYVQGVDTDWQSISGDWQLSGTTVSGHHTGDIHGFLSCAWRRVGNLLDYIHELENPEVAESETTNPTTSDGDERD